MDGRGDVNAGTPACARVNCFVLSRRPVGGAGTSADGSERLPRFPVFLISLAVV